MDKRIELIESHEALRRENERLRASMLEAYRLIIEGEIFEATAILKIVGEGKEEGGL